MFEINKPPTYYKGKIQNYFQSIMPVVKTNKLKHYGFGLHMTANFMILLLLQARDAKAVRYTIVC